MLSEKVLIMPSYEDGNHLKETSVRDGSSFFNMRIETLSGIAKNRCQTYVIKNNYRIIDGSIAKLYIYGILRELKMSQQLRYFGALSISPGFVNSIYNTIYELRMADYTSNNLKDSYFINKDKAADIVLISSEYEQFLSNNSFLDDYELYQLAMGLDNKYKDKLTYMIPTNLKLKNIESKFLRFLTEGKIEFVEPRLNSTINNNPLNYLFDIGNLPKDLPNLNIEFSSALGKSNEAKEVIRNIKDNKINFDNVLVLYSSREPYSQYFYLLSQKMDLPITFGEGISVKNTFPGKLYFSLIDWINDNYNVVNFISILNSGYFYLEEEAPSINELIGLLKEAKIIRGRERYCTNIDLLIEQTKKELDRKNSENRFVKLTWFSNFIKDLLSNLPLPDDKGIIDLADFAKGMHIIIDKYSKSNSEMDIEAKQNILEKLDIIIEHVKGLIDIKDGLLQLTEIMGDAMVCRSGPKQGHIHLSSYKKGIWISRENTFIIGFDASTFPGQTREDPILLDVERQELGNGINLNKEMVKEKLSDMNQLLVNIKGNIYMSYSNFDTVENKAQSPSSILLQTYRLQMRDSRLDYEALNKKLAKVAGFIINSDNKMLDENDWWLNKQILENARITGEQFAYIYPNISKGLYALNNRSSDTFTEYDGKVEFDFDEAGIMRDGMLIFSASRLETLAACPYKYFLKHILKAKKPDDIEFNSVQWLDPASRGTLLHKVFEIFYQELNVRNEKPSIIAHTSLIKDIATKEMGKILELLDPPSNLIYELEANEILDTCDIFLSYEVKNLGEHLPSYLEMSFGLDECNKELGVIPEVEMKLKNGKAIYINGKIDRVDKLSIDDFVIIDYKTGSARNYNDNDYFQNGTHLQHALYAIAFETIIKDKGICNSPNVSKSVYLFPTVKGEGRAVIRLREKRNDVYDVLEKLLTIVEEGSFISCDEEHCKYCDYRVVCENVSSAEAIKQMRANSQDIGIVSLRGLGIYE